jgi:uncharacterized protein (TIGR00106 family)
MDKGESVSKYVARSLDIIASSGLPYRLGPMGTCLEGDWDTVMAVIKQCHDRMAQDCRRISVSIKMDIRQGHEGRLTSKIARIESILGRELDKERS